MFTENYLEKVTSSSFHSRREKLRKMQNFNDHCEIEYEIYESFWSLYSRKKCKIFPLRTFIIENCEVECNDGFNITKLRVQFGEEIAFSIFTNVLSICWIDGDRNERKND